LLDTIYFSRFSYQNNIHKMHSVIVALVAIAGLAAAGPTVQKRAECPGTGSYYVCANNNFRGYCSVDPCAITWCPDFEDKTCDPVEASTGGDDAPVVAPETVKKPSGGSDPTVCPSGTGFFQSCSNGFRGCCKKDACSGAWCPDYKTGTYEPVKTLKVKARQADPTVCAPGTGFFQSCATNGFRGCCKGDACTGAWCPDFKVGTYEAVEIKARQSDPTVCAPGTGFFQSCSNGFRGCCKKDACAGKAAVCPQ